MSEENVYARQSSSSSSCHGSEESITIATILSKEICENGSLGKRLSHLDSIPHQPRVNGEIPDQDNATLDHGMLLERLTMYGLAEFQIEGDGNCQFRAIADQLFRNPEYHRHVRKEVVKQLKIYHNLYEGYVPMSYKSYLKMMKRSGEWGDHVTLQAAADRGLNKYISDFNIKRNLLNKWRARYTFTASPNGSINTPSEFKAKICLITSFRDTYFIEITPKDQVPSNEIWLSFWSEVHYNSLYAADDVPARVTKRKHWLF